MKETTRSILWSLLLNDRLMCNDRNSDKREMSVRDNENRQNYLLGL